MIYFSPENRIIFGQWESFSRLLKFKPRPRAYSAVQTATDLLGRIKDGSRWKCERMVTFGIEHDSSSKFEIHKCDSSILFLCLGPPCCWLSPRQPSAELEQFSDHAHEARESQVWQQVCSTVAGRLRVSDARQQKSNMIEQDLRNEKGSSGQHSKSITSYTSILPAHIICCLLESSSDAGLKDWQHQWCQQEVQWPSRSPL